MLGLNTINLSTKFEISTFTHYEDTKGNENVEIGVVLGGWRSPKVIGNITTRYRAYDFLFDLNRNYASIFTVFELQPDICPKSPMLTYTSPALSTPAEVPLMNFVEIFGARILQSLSYHVALFT